MPEYCPCELGLLIMIIVKMLQLARVMGTDLLYEFAFSKRRNLLSAQKVEKVVLYDNRKLRNISSCKRLTGTAAELGSPLLNYQRNKM